MSADPVVVAQQLMADVWAQLEAVCGGKPPVLPQKLVWLNGAPGAGKGTNTRIIKNALRVESQPVVISDLLSSPEFMQIKNSGCLVGDKDVVGLLLRKLLEPQYAKGVIIDGFPRSRPQAEFLRLLITKMEQLAIDHPGVCIRPRVRLLVLDVPEDIAVERQLKRGRETMAANEQARRNGGTLQEVRATDVDPLAAAKRFRVFQEQTVGALQSLQDSFRSHFIDASADIPTVARLIEAALAETQLHRCVPARSGGPVAVSPPQG